MAGLTVKSVETARATSDRREIADSYMRGLYLVVQPTGSKSWAVRYRHGGKSCKDTLGPYPAFDLKQAPRGRWKDFAGCGGRPRPAPAPGRKRRRCRRAVPAAALQELPAEVAQ
jgi:Arm domain-containing DNA-binding protein